MAKNAFKPGDRADHKGGHLDPREVAEVKGGKIRLLIGDVPDVWVPASNYRRIINPDRIEERSYGGYTPGPSTMGRTIVYITCPFCSTTCTAYLWSLSGGGKKCTCGAKFDAYGNAKKERED